MKTNDILLVGALGVAAYFLFTKTAGAGADQDYPSPNQDYGLKADVMPLMPQSAIKSAIAGQQGISAGGVVSSYVPIADLQFQEKGIAPVKTTVVAIGGEGQNLSTSSSGGSSSAKSSGLALKFAGSGRVMPMSSGFAAKLASITKSSKK